MNSDLYEIYDVYSGYNQSINNQNTFNAAIHGVKLKGNSNKRAPTLHEHEDILKNTKRPD